MPKRKASRNEEEEEDEPVNGGGEKQPKRSVRKRRKRTNDEAKEEAEKELKRQKMAQEDEEMEEAADDGDLKMPAQPQSTAAVSPGNTSQSQVASPSSTTDAAAAASTTTTHAAKVAAKRVPNVANLRVPSEQTPGKPSNETARLDGNLPVPSMALILDQEEEDRRRAAATAAEKESMQVKRPAAMNGTDEDEKEDEATRSPVVLGSSTATMKRRDEAAAQSDQEEAVPADGQEQQRQPNALSMIREKVQESAPVIQEWVHERAMYTSWCFLFLFVLQLVCTFIIGNPFLAISVGGSKWFTRGYRAVLPSPAPKPAPVPEVSPKQVQREQEMSQAVDHRKHHLKSLTQRLAKARGQVQLELSDLGDEGLMLEQTTAATKLAAANDAASLGKVSQLEASLSKTDGPQDLAAVRELLGEDSNYLLDLSTIPLWQVPPEPKCDQEEEERVQVREEEEEAPVPEGLLHEEDLFRGMDVLQNEIRQATEGAKTDKNVIDKIVSWIREKTEQGGPLVLDRKPVRQVVSSPGRFGSSLSAIRGFIEARLEQEHADRTGKVDYAAVRNGASVIKTGHYATSPSLVDTLPYINRLAASLSLRFYGHGPEVALMPIYPQDALGQCWAFQQDTNSKAGRYATLTIQLARRIEVATVSIQHPPREINDKSKAAIRAFRVYGFETPNATGKRWDLGNFEFSLSGDKIQEFEVETDDDEEEIPPLQSLSLAIDSNWGLQYACLYRFRVHGKEIKNQ